MLLDSPMTRNHGSMASKFLLSMLLLQSRKKSRLRRRLTILVVLALPVAAYFGWGAVSGPLLRRYHVWKQEKALVRAKEFIAQKDPASAKLEIDIALIAVPGSPEAIRVAADLLQLVGSPQELSFRRQIADQNPDSVPDRLALITAALRLRDFNAARDALASFTSAQAEQPAVLRAYLGYALGVNNRPMADALFDRLSAIAAPDDDMRALHAMLLRQHPNGQKSAAAKKELETLAQNPKFSLTLNRAFFNEALVAKDLPAAKRFAALVSADPAATFSDRLNEATVQLLVDHQPFDAVLARLTPAASATGETAAELVRWLIVQGKSAEAERWLAPLPAPIAGTPAVAGVRMELAVVAKDWDQFGKLLEQGAWGPIPLEVARLAMAAHVAGARKVTLRKQIWDETMAAAGDNPVTARVLLRVATTWRWEEETEALLWSVVKLDPAQAWAHAALMGAYRQRGDGKKMLEVMTVLKNSAPTSKTYRHDWALLSLLVSPLSDWDAPKVTAKEVYLADSANPNYAATYALALSQAGKADEARAVVEKLSAADRDYPLRAPYLAFVYGHSRRQAEFDQYAALSAQAPLLREERQLIEQTREFLTRPVASPASTVKPPAKATATAVAKPPSKI